MRVHPVADLFPMLPEDELDDLAEDIKANGLQHPIVVKDGELIDGRNRLAACELAGVDPSFEELDGQDPVAYILSANLARRHMNQGQKAIAGARVTQIVYGQQTELARIVGVPQQRISEAVQILEHAPDEADDVLADKLAFSSALKTAKEKRDAQLSEAERHENELVELGKTHPDLEIKVRNGVKTFAEAQQEVESWRQSLLSFGGVMSNARHIARLGQGQDFDVHAQQIRTTDYFDLEQDEVEDAIVALQRLKEVAYG